MIAVSIKDTSFVQHEFLRRHCYWNWLLNHCRYKFQVDTTWYSRTTTYFDYLLSLGIFTILGFPHIWVRLNTSHPIINHIPVCLVHKTTTTTLIAIIPWTIQNLLIREFNSLLKFNSNKSFKSSNSRKSIISCTASLNNNILINSFFSPIYVSWWIRRILYISCTFCCDISQNVLSYFWLYLSKLLFELFFSQRSKSVQTHIICGLSQFC